MRSRNASSYSPRAVLATAFAALAFSAANADAATWYKNSSADPLNQTTTWWTTQAGGTNPVSIGTTDTLWFGGTSQAASGTWALGGNLSVGAIRLDNVTGTPNYNAGVSAGNTLTLNGNNDYSGSYLSGLVLNSAAGGSLTIATDVVVASTQKWVSSRTLTVTGNVDLGGNTLSLFAAGQTTTLSGTISGSGGISRTDSAGGTAVLSNVANTYTGATRLVSGILSVSRLANGGAASSIGAASNAAGNLVFNGGTLVYTGGGDSTDRAFTIQANTAITANGSGGLTWTAASPSFVTANTAYAVNLGGTSTAANTFGTVLANNGSGTISLQKTGTGLWIVTGANTATGSTSVQQGTLRVTGGGVLGGVAGSTTDPGNIVFGTANSNAAVEFETAANLGPADQVRFRNTGGTAGSGGALRYVGTTNQTVSKTLFCDTSIGIRLESDSVGGRLLVNGPFSQTTRPLYLGGSGTGSNELATAFTSTGALTKRGTGTWVLSTNNTYTGATAVEAGTLLVTGTIGSTSGVTVSSGASLGGSGRVAAALAGAGWITPGSSDGILSAASVSPASGVGFSFEFSGTGSPTYSNSSASVNDVLRLTGTSAFSANLTAANVVDIYLDRSSVLPGDTFRGGFYVDASTNFAPSINDATFSYWVLGNGGGSDKTYNGQGYYSLAAYDSSYSITRSTVADTANFASGTVSGGVSQFIVVPEPAASTAGLLAAAGAAWMLRRRTGQKG